MYLILFKHVAIFPPDDLHNIQTNLATMQFDVQMRYREALDQSHHGRPTILTKVHGHGRGRPRYAIDRGWLAWAYQHRTTSGNAQFLQVSRWVVRNALLEYGITSPQAPPLPLASQADTSTSAAPPAAALYTGPLSVLTDTELDDLLFHLHQHYIRAGVAMLDGMLQRLGHQIPRQCIRQSLIIIHGFINGYSRLIIGLRAHNNNCAATVLLLFLEAAYIYGVPSHL
ncbi:hypothetical protein DAEQUDRAFT_666931, partial [Daedalea quercina L-15889]